MGFFIACKAFIKALKDRKAALAFLSCAQQKSEAKGQEENTHLRLLALLQHSGRFIDFIQEDISGYSDAQVGAAVRPLHEKCRETLESCVAVRPVLEDAEGSHIQVPKGYDPTQIKVVGAVKGDAPYKGRLVHRGWRAQSNRLPKNLGQQSSDVLCPAEVELS